MLKNVRLSVCSCGKLSVIGQGHCLECHAAYMRKWRKTHKLTGEARLRDIARHYLAVYVRRGKVAKLPCEICGENQVESHHEDYSKPLAARWLCRPHHVDLTMGRLTLPDLAKAA